MKFSDLCQHCQSTSNRELCKQCQQGRETESLRRELIKKDNEIRYWQECYDTLLQNERSYDGANGGL